MFYVNKFKIALTRLFLIMSVSLISRDSLALSFDCWLETEDRESNF